MAIKIGVDAGHGSQTAGKRTPPMPVKTDLAAKGEQIREHWGNTWVAYYAAYYLAKYGFEVVRTGWDDTNSRDDADTPLGTRQTAIKKAGCLLSVSCHFNAHGNGSSFTSAEGVETLVHSNTVSRKQSEALAKAVQARLVKSGQRDRGVRSGDLAMCNAVAMGTEASILCEYGFMTNLAEAKLMGSKAYLKECGHRTALGIWDYLSSKPKKEISSMTAATGEVIWLQVKLRLAGEAVMATGIWDGQTVAAVKSYWLKQTGNNCTGKKVSERCIKILE